MERVCDACGATYEAVRTTARYCSTRCRTRASRAGIATKRPRKPNVVMLDVMQPPADGAGPIESATALELDRADALTSATGARALMLARLLDAPPPTGLSSIAGWSREHAAALKAATANAEQVQTSSALDRVRARRDAKRHA